MQKKNKIIIVIVDGYNVIRRSPELNKHFSKSPEAGREALVRYCAQRKAGRKDVFQFYVVFDGDSSVVGVGDQSIPWVQVIYSETGETADSRILSLVRDKSGDAKYVVVSDDNEVSRNSSSLGAEVMSVSEFCNKPARSRKSRARTSRHDTKATLSPAQQKEINESLKKAWGLV